MYLLTIITDSAAASFFISFSGTCIYSKVMHIVVTYKSRYISKFVLDINL